MKDKTKIMSLSISAECLTCHFNRYMKKAQLLGDRETAFAFGKDLMRMYLDAPEGVSSPWFSPQVAQLIQTHYGVGDSLYEEEKRMANTFIMERFDHIQALVEQAEDPVFAGLQFSILGNYLDFAALQGKVSFEKLEQMLREALDMKLDMDVYESLKADLAKGKKLLYLTDNAGEIGMDRIFAEEIHKAYPHLEITFCVRGGNTINDATREDAAVVGIPFPVIDNGNLVSGTELSMLSQEAKDAMDTADVIIAKGMANTETMWGCDYNVYYAFLVKCQRFVNLFEQPLFTPMLVRQRDKGEK
jgi:uncharacterized protein with ATP-grasp and redox domains